MFVHVHVCPPIVSPATRPDAVAVEPFGDGRRWSPLYCFSRIDTEKYYYTHPYTHLIYSNTLNEL